MARDHYRTLRIRPNSSQAEIKKAYLDMVRKCHPDLHPGDLAAKRRFQQVQAAFEVLHDPEKRKTYNRSCISSFTVKYHVYDHPGPSGYQTQQAATHHAMVQVSEPAIGLIITTAMGISVQLFALFGCLLQGGGRATPGGPLEVPLFAGDGLSLLVGIIGCILGIVVIAAAIQMNNLDNYRLAVTGAILATVSCVSPWFLLGLPFGIWALVVLCNQQVRDAFWS